MVAGPAGLPGLCGRYDNPVTGLQAREHVKAVPVPIWVIGV